MNRRSRVYDRYRDGKQHGHTWSEANNERVSPLCTHEQVFLRMRMPASAFVDARRYLEAAGLLKTFVSEGEDFKIYHYELYAPKSPSGFFFINIGKFESFW